eukprot:TRINITY_DN71348_c0_g1_i1.p1 TRINITY_DN71348_c0_g1~~TRINITY_DN71348_c0_g1_i1.p1  ORF type:complete len:432 (+),score=86.11 TRINITY_DN71348_c0_g1_i1:103-1398(+)
MAAGADGAIEEMSNGGAQAQTESHSAPQKGARDRRPLPQVPTREGVTGPDARGTSAESSRSEMKRINALNLEPAQHKPSGSNQNLQRWSGQKAGGQALLPERKQQRPEGGGGGGGAGKSGGASLNPQAAAFTPGTPAGGAGAQGGGGGAGKVQPLPPGQTDMPQLKLAKTTEFSEVRLDDILQGCFLKVIKERPDMDGKWQYATGPSFRTVLGEPTGVVPTPLTNAGGMQGGPMGIQGQPQGGTAQAPQPPMGGGMPQGALTGPTPPMGGMGTSPSQMQNMQGGYMMTNMPMGNVQQQQQQGYPQVYFMQGPGGGMPGQQQQMMQQNGGNQQGGMPGALVLPQGMQGQQPQMMFFNPQMMPNMGGPNQQMMMMPIQHPGPCGGGPPGGGPGGPGGPGPGGCGGPGGPGGRQMDGGDGGQGQGFGGQQQRGW